MLVSPPINYRGARGIRDMAVVRPDDGSSGRQLPLACVLDDPLDRRRHRALAHVPGVGTSEGRPEVCLAVDHGGSSLQGREPLFRSLDICRG